MICIECMTDKKDHEYYLVHYVVAPDDLVEFSNNPRKFKGCYCVCLQCMEKPPVFQSLASIQ